ncbi:hypothetical protein F5883DRAFT_613969 [Diaporthe sp. PMI_573]|nr:hypothetical protein F5883DRAFT_613969 [Diaporthaceae sp. PMI_573]
MSSPDREVLEAAQVLCMLAMGKRQQEDMNKDNKTQEDDDYTITLVRPAVKSEQEVDGDETEDDGCVITHSRPVAKGQKDVSRGVKANDDRATTQIHPMVNRPVVHGHHPYRRPEPRQVTLFADRPRMLHDPNLKDEWAERARRLLHERAFSISRAGADGKKAGYSQGSVHDPAPAFSFNSPFPRQTPVTNGPSIASVPRAVLFRMYTA